MAPAALVVLTTLATEEDARRLVTALVGERLVACGTLVTGARSIYRWEGELREENEVLVVLKTDASRWDALAAAVRERHPYAVPELLALPIERGLGGRPGGAPPRGRGRRRRGRRRRRAASTSWWRESPTTWGCCCSGPKCCVGAGTTPPRSAISSARCDWSRGTWTPWRRLAWSCPARACGSRRRPSSRASWSSIRGAPRRGITWVKR